LRELVKQYGLEEDIQFHNEMPHLDLVKLIKKANALILYSRYETFGCVLIEANACGVPVIVSDIPVMHENVHNNFNGLFATNEDFNALAAQINYFIKSKHLFNNQQIAEQALKQYDYSLIGMQFRDWYNQQKLKD
jgi:glycosyltransferase involved in cell wall biosynthesis